MPRVWLCCRAWGSATGSNPAEKWQKSWAEGVPPHPLEEDFVCSLFRLAREGGQRGGRVIPCSGASDPWSGALCPDTLAIPRILQGGPPGVRAVSASAL